VCTRVSNEVMVRVEPPLNFDVSSNVTICAGATTTLTMSNYPEEAVTFWIEGDINADDFMNAFKDALVGETTNLLEALMNMMFSTLDDIVPDDEYTEDLAVEDESEYPISDEEDDLTNEEPINEDELPLIDESVLEGIFTSLGIIGMEPTIDVTPTTTTTYTAVVMGVCTATRQVTVTVDGAVTPTVSAPTTICMGDNTQLVATGGTTYRWTPATGLNNPNISNPIASPSVTTVYSVEITRGTCSYVTETTVTVVPLPVITNIEETNVREVTAYVENGLPPYSYSINNRDFITHNVLHDVSIGGHILYVVDMNNCKTSRPFEVTPIPIFPAKFFTPNDDGVNDYWTIENLNVYPSYIVQIFDRFGKLIYELRSGQFHADGEVNYHPFQWDGNYLGHPLPSTDYWYLITLEEVRKQYTGHFTLKR
ncbi:MAG: T9SS type B sorting domain-containing protein, partial [Paludibacteraceae bacterium]|nr:T9SS type B sorting domain-containing protein [Paludibacteraceae bacterium]